MKLTLGLYGVYLLLVAVSGNAAQLTKMLQQDIPAFLPWLIVAAVLGALYEFGPTHAFAASFILLVLVTFLLINYQNLKAQFSGIYSGATK